MPFYSLAQLRRYERLAKEGAEGATQEKLDAGLLESDLASIPARKGPPKPATAAQDGAEPQETDDDFRARMVARKAAILAAAGVPAPKEAPNV